MGQLVALSCLCNPLSPLLSPQHPELWDQGRTPRNPLQGSDSSGAATPHILGKNGSIPVCSLCCSGHMDEVMTFFYSPLFCVLGFAR